MGGAGLWMTPVNAGRRQGPEAAGQRNIFGKDKVNSRYVNPANGHQEAW